MTEPIIEAVMIDTKGQPGISFARNGLAVREVVASNNTGEEGKDTSSTSAEDE